MLKQVYSRYFADIKEIPDLLKTSYLPPWMASGAFLFSGRYYNDPIGAHLFETALV
jgi:hypothetical protein